MSYPLVLPRDAFNQAKLLKCLGRVCLKILDMQTIVRMTYEIQGDGNNFSIHQDMSSGDLFVSNIIIKIDGQKFDFHTKYNSKANYPLYCKDKDDNEFLVFDEDGEWYMDFEILCLKVQTRKSKKNVKSKN